MSYIGKSPVVGNFQVCDAISVVNNQAAYTMQVGSANVFPESANHMLVSLNGILQKPNGSFTISGSTITFASALVTNDVIDFIQLLGDVLDLGTPSDATVTNAKTNFTSTSSAAGLQIKGDGTTDGTLQLNCSQNSHGIKLASPAHSSSQSYTLKFPTGNVTANKFLKVASVSGSGTSGVGQLSFAEAGGSWTLVSTTTASNNSYVDITFSGSYSIYKITFVNMIGGTDNTNLNHQILIGGSVQTGTSYKYGNLFVDSNGGNGYNASGSAGSVKMTYAPMGSATGDNTNGQVTIYKPGNTLIKHTDWTFNGTQKVGSYMNKNVGGSSWGGATTAWSGFRVLYSSGNIASGVMKLWGQA